MNDNTETIAVDIPPELQTQLEARIEGTDFESLDAYVRFVLETIVAESDASSETSTEQEEMNPELETRLEDLGYM